MIKAIVAIPVYKKEISEEERASLIQAAKILSTYPFVLICPEGLDTTEYRLIMEHYHCNYSVESFLPEFFESVQTYSQLMLSLDFYQRFANTEYMLIYQLDAWVFRDELEYWCKQDYDYIGAPWFVGFEAVQQCSEKVSFLPFAGNGGFSLRKIPSFIEILSKVRLKKYNMKRWKTYFDLYKENKKRRKFLKVLKLYLSYTNSLQFYFDNNNEDLVIVECFKKIKPKFKLAEYSTAMKFSFEVHPEKLYQLNNHQLPFGCHAFWKYDYSFWQQFIDVKKNIQEMFLSGKD